jgi:hypothetical protein
VDITDSGSCLMMNVGIIGVKPSGFDITVLVR